MTPRPLHFYPTPAWVAEALIDRHFAALGRSDLVLEPTCGDGRFLQAIPAHVPAIGIEIDPSRADAAARRTGRRIIVGDVRTVELDAQPTVILGNPPFITRLIDRLLERAWHWLPQGGRAGFILPAYTLGTALRVVGMTERWSIEQESIPKSLYPRVRFPLCFALFTKDRRRRLVGFALFREAAAIQGFAPRYRAILEGTSGSVWATAVLKALAALGGEAELSAVYGELERQRPTANRFWREKVRQTLQLHARRTGRGRWAIPAADHGSAAA